MDVGAHCYLKSCHQKDFLPFECKFCKKKFCQEHREPHNHDCQNENKGDMKVAICKHCKKSIKYDAGIKTEEEAIDEHAKMQCTKSSNQSQVEQKCQAPKCNVKITKLNGYQCSRCNKQTCLKHRYEEEHDCISKTEVVKPAEESKHDNSSKSQNNQGKGRKDLDSDPIKIEINQEKEQEKKKQKKKKSGFARFFCCSS